jgi:hypothetical protein
MHRNFLGRENGDGRLSGGCIDEVGGPAIDCDE